MKIVVIGGTGLIGSKTVAILRQRGHEVVAASPNTGVNTITGAGLREAMAGTQVVIDLANSPSFEDKAVLEFFEISGRNLLAAAAAAGVRHHVALSIVGTDRTPSAMTDLTPSTRWARHVGIVVRRTGQRMQSRHSQGWHSLRALRSLCRMALLDRSHRADYSLTWPSSGPDIRLRQRDPCPRRSTHASEETNRV